MRILVDAVAARTGGGPVRIRELARTFPSLRPEFDFLFAVPRDFEPVVDQLAPHVKTLVPPAFMDRMPARLWWEHQSLPRASRGRGIDAAFSPFNIVPTRWPGRRPILALIVSNLAPYAPQLRTMYGGRARLRLDALRRLTNRTIRRADLVFLLSHQAYDLIGRGVLRDRAEVIPMAPPTVLDVPVDTSRIPDRPFFFFSSDLARYKGLEIAIEALALVRDSDQPLLLVSGRSLEPDYAARMKALAVTRGVEQRVRFLGSISHDEVLGLMSRSVACVTPSRFENMSRVPFEAMAVGTPVLASDIPASREACGEAARYFSLNRPDELTSMMEDLVADGAARESMAEAGLARVRGMTPSSASERILSSIERLVG